MNLAYHPDRFDHAQLAKDVLQANPVLYTKISVACEIEEFQVPQSLTEVIRFLNLIAVSETVLTPSKFLDHVWHEFILCTRAYWSFCERKFGRMIHHHPGGSEEKNREQFRRTLELYREHFGAPEPCFWECAALPGASDCGGCDAD